MIEVLHRFATLALVIGLLFVIAVCWDLHRQLRGERAVRDQVDTYLYQHIDDTNKELRRCRVEPEVIQWFEQATLDLQSRVTAIEAEQKETKP